MIADRLLRAFLAIVDARLETTKCHVKVRYRVITKSGPDRYELQAVRKGEWPDLVPCAVAPGASGYKADLALGSVVLVEFIEGDATLPRITAFEEPGQPGFVPVSIKIAADSGTAPAAARVGDFTKGLLVPGPISGTITIGGTPSPFVGTFTLPIEIITTIQAGSTKVGIGG